MAALITTGVNVSSRFPSAAYDGVHRHLRELHAEKPAYALYCGAWNAVSYRYLEAQVCAGQFARSFQKHGPGPTPLYRSRQERLIFDFYASAVSCFDCCAFSIFAMASFNHPKSFPLFTEKDEKEATTGKLLKLLTAHFPHDDLTAAWKHLTDDQRFLDLKDLRNVLSHRLVGTRHFFAGGANDGKGLWGKYQTPITKDFLRLPLETLDVCLAMVMPAINAFARERC